MFKIKADPKIPYHYLIGVAIHTPHSKECGNLYLKYFLEFGHEDIEKVRTALRLSKDRMFPSGITKEEAVKIAGCGQIIWAISAMKLSAGANQATIHHFSSTTPLDDKFFEGLVSRATNNKHDKELLNKSRIIGG